MKRVLFSIFVGAAGVAALLVPTLLLEKSVEAAGDGGWRRALLRASFWALGWPLPFFSRVFPNAPGSSLKYSVGSLAASLLCNVLVVAALTYFLLRRRAAARARKSPAETLAEIAALPSGGASGDFSGEEHDSILYPRT